MDSVRMVSMLRRSMSGEAMAAEDRAPAAYETSSLRGLRAEEEPRRRAAPRAEGRTVRRLGVDEVVDVGLELGEHVVGLALGDLLVAHRLVEPGLLRGHDRVLESLGVLALRLGDVGQGLPIAQLGAQRALAEPEVLGGRRAVRAEAEADFRAAIAVQPHVRVDDVVDVRLQLVEDVVGLAL